MSASFAEYTGTEPVWERTVHRAPRPHFIGRYEVDVAVVGGGLAGLSAAYHLARLRPDLSVLVVEAERIGAGASGRSTGIVGPGVGGRIGALRRKFGSATARDMFRYSQRGVDLVTSLVRDEGIDCDLTPSAHLLCARTQVQAARLAKEHAAFAELGLPVPLLDAAELAGRLGHPSYFAALAYEPVVLVNPLKLTLGLADAAVRAGVRVVEAGRVTEMSQRRGRVRLQIGVAGMVDARTVVVATDGYTPAGFPYGRRLVGVRTHVLATRPLSPDERESLRWSGREAVIDQRTFFSYYRFDAHGRLLFGGGPVCRPSAGPSVSGRIWRRLELEMTQLFPSLREVPVEHRWSGVTGATLDRLPVVGEVPGRPGVVFLGAWTGHGLAMSVAGGASLAQRLAGKASPASHPWYRSRTGNPRLGPLRAGFVVSYVAALDAGDRLGAALQRLRSPSAATTRSGSASPTPPSSGPPTQPETGPPTQPVGMVHAAAVRDEVPANEAAT